MSDIPIEVRTNRAEQEARKFIAECLAYEHEDGVLRWKRRPREHFAGNQAWTAWNTKYPGKAAGNRRRDGYISITLGKTHYLAHRVIWLLVTGEEPTATIDHRDGDPRNNKWTNLRAATYSENLRNSTGRKSATALKGVSVDPRSKRSPFKAAIQVGRKRFHLGCFPTAELAHQAYCEAARKYHGEFWSDGKRLP